MFKSLIKFTKNSISPNFYDFFIKDSITIQDNFERIQMPIIHIGFHHFECTRWSFNHVLNICNQWKINLPDEFFMISMAYFGLNLIQLFDFHQNIEFFYDPSKYRLNHYFSKNFSYSGIFSHLLDHFYYK